MKPKQLRVAREALGICLAIAACGVHGAPPDSPGAVLDVREAATLLRVPPKIVLKLASAGNIPARRVGKDWRFSRDALLHWLQGERFAYPVDGASHADAPEPAALSATDSPRRSEADGLGAVELAAVTGRGARAGQGLRLAQAAGLPADSAPPAAPAQAGGPGTVGERPSSLSAEDVALRQQGAAILPGGVATLEFGLAYARQVRENFPVLRVEQSTVIATLTGRYGLKDDLQLTARLPYDFQRTLVFGDTGVLGDNVTLDRRENYLGDMALSLVAGAMAERSGRPNLLLSLDAVLPTGPGDSGLGAGVVVSKSYDPVVIFAGLNYLYGIDTDPNDTQRILARNNVGFNLGYAYAVNDSIALSGQFAGYYRSPQRGVLPPEKESYLVQLGLTWQLGRGLYVEPAVAFGVGGAAPDLSLSLNLPYTF